jgi:hypothetical protein
MAEATLQRHTTLEREIKCLERDTTHSVQDIFTLITLLNQDLSNLTQRVQTPSGVPTSPNMALEVRDLAARLTRLEINSAAPPPSHAIVPEMETLKIQLKLIESRIPAFNVLKLGGKIFNSKTEVAVLIETKLLSNDFYLFHDVVTLMERFSGSYGWQILLGKICCLLVTIHLGYNVWPNHHFEPLILGLYLPLSRHPPWNL